MRDGLQSIHCASEGKATLAVRALCN